MKHWLIQLMYLEQYSSHQIQLEKRLLRLKSNKSSKKLMYSWMTISLRLSRLVTLKAVFFSGIKTRGIKESFGVSALLVTAFNDNELSLYHSYQGRHRHSRNINAYFNLERFIEKSHSQSITVRLCLVGFWRMLRLQGGMKRNGCYIMKILLKLLGVTK